MELKSLDRIPFDSLFRAFARAFSDYDIRRDQPQLQSMLRRRGFDPALSFAVFEGEQIVAFTFNGTGMFDGVPTAYDTGTGTLQAYRGQGLATRIFEYAIPHFRQANVRQYLLEVLQHNTPAVSVYRKLGFEVTREFNYFGQSNREVRNQVQSPDPGYTLKPIDIEAYPEIPGFWDFTPSWQNSFESIRRAAGDFSCLGIFTGENLVGYCVFEPASGDVTQLAVDRDHRRKGVGSLLLREMVECNRNDALKVVNTDTRCESITAFLQAKNIPVTGQQFEMIKQI